MPPLPLDAQLLRILREQSLHLPGPELAKKLRIGPMHVRTRIAILRDAGYDILEQPRGYKLRSTPDRIIGDDILSRLGQVTLIRELVVFEETGSTNDVAAQAGRSGAAEGLVVFAEKQTSGKGRLGRSWESSAGRGLWFSLLLRPEIPLHLWPRLTTWVAVAVAQGIEETTPSLASIKWPNDIYVSERKVAGILTETQVDSNGRHFAAVGIGINVNQEQDDFPEHLHGKAGSLRMAAGQPLDRQRIAAAILRRLDAAYASFASNFAETVAEALSRSLLAGCWVEIGGQEGAVEGLDGEGALLVRKADGELITLRGGEVSVSNWRAKTP